MGKCSLLGRLTKYYWIELRLYIYIIQFSSVIQSCPTLCDPTDCSTPGLPVHHQLPEITQPHIRRVSDAIQPSHPLSSPSPPTFNLSQHQGLFYWVGSLHQVAKLATFSFSISPSNKYSGLISFRIDWLEQYNNNYRLYLTIILGLEEHWRKRVTLRLIYIYYLLEKY